MTVVFLLVLTIQPVYAGNQLQIVGNHRRLEVIPKDQNLFKELNLSPGDYRKSNLTIKNNDKDSFELFVKIQRLGKKPSSAEADLYKKLFMTITLGNREIYTGPMMNFASGKNISLGKIKPGEVREMEAVVHLPGADTGNEFMGVSHRNQWTFIAQSHGMIDEEDSPSGPKLPKTGGMPTAFFYITGALITLTGIVIKNKK